MNAFLPDAPPLQPLCHIVCEVGALVSLGFAPGGERRYVPILGGTVSGPQLNGIVLPGGVDWQVARPDGALDIQARYVLRLHDGSLVEVDSRGLRHGPAEVMQRLTAGEVVDRRDYFFRTFIRLTTGAPAWMHLNKVLALAVAERAATRVLLDVYEVS